MTWFKEENPRMSRQAVSENGIAFHHLQGYRKKSAIDEEDQKKFEKLCDQSRFDREDLIPRTMTRVKTDSD
jgi:hypothetical protein